MRAPAVLAVLISAFVLAPASAQAQGSSGDIVDIVREVKHDEHLKSVIVRVTQGERVLVNQAL